MAGKKKSKKKRKGKRGDGLGAISNSRAKGNDGGGHQESDRGSTEEFDTPMPKECPICFLPLPILKKPYWHCCGWENYSSLAKLDHMSFDDKYKLEQPIKRANDEYGRLGLQQNTDEGLKLVQ